MEIILHPFLIKVKEYSKNTPDEYIFGGQFSEINTISKIKDNKKILYQRIWSTIKPQFEESDCINASLPFAGCGTQEISGIILKFDPHLYGGYDIAYNITKNTVMINRVKYENFDGDSILYLYADHKKYHDIITYLPTYKEPEFTFINNTFIIKRFINIERPSKLIKLDPTLKKEKYELELFPFPLINYKENEYIWCQVDPQLINTITFDSPVYMIKEMILWHDILPSEYVLGTIVSFNPEFYNSFDIAYNIDKNIILVTGAEYTNFEVTDRILYISTKIKYNDLISWKSTYKTPEIIFNNNSIIINDKIRFNYIDIH
jgi:hypothetical protein